MAESTLHDLHSPDWKSSDGGFQLLQILNDIEPELLHHATLHAQKARTDIHPDHIELAVLRAVSPGRAMAHGPNASDTCIAAVRDLLVRPHARQNALQWLNQPQQASPFFCYPLYACVQARAQHALATM